MYVKFKIIKANSVFIETKQLRARFVDNVQPMCEKLRTKYSPESQVRGLYVGVRLIYEATGKSFTATKHAKLIVSVQAKMKMGQVSDVRQLAIDQDQ